MAGQYTYSFIKPLVGHFWYAELALWDEPKRLLTASMMSEAEKSC